MCKREEKKDSESERVMGRGRERGDKENETNDKKK
jgi:hypothetical protein